MLNGSERIIKRKTGLLNLAQELGTWTTLGGAGQCALLIFE